MLQRQEFAFLLFIASRTFFLIHPPRSINRLNNFFMKIFTHYPVAAPQSLFVSASLHRPHYLTGQPVLFLLTLLSGLLLLSVGTHAQPFNLNTVNHPLITANTGGRSAPVFVDIDNDGDKDCFVGSTDGTIWFYKNLGTATAPMFVLQSNGANPMNGQDVGNYSKPAFVDIDADGDFDCFSGAGDGTIYFFLNEGSASAPLFSALTDPITANGTIDGNPFFDVSAGVNSAPAFIDIDNDGDYDCFIGRGSTSNSILYYRNDGDNMVPFYVSVLLQNPLFNQSISNATPTFVDIDSDGDLDCFVGRADGRFLYYMNNGGIPNTFAPFTSPLDVGTPNPKDISSSNTDYSVPTFVDIDGDGDLDAFSGRSTGALVFYKNESCLNAPQITACPNMTVSLTAGSASTANAGIVANNNGCAGSLNTTYSIATVGCSNYPSAQVTATVTNTTNFRSTTCTYTVSVTDNVAPVNGYAGAPACSATPYYVDLGPNGTAFMGTIDPATVIKTFTDNSGCTPIYTISAQPPAVFSFNCNNIVTSPAYTLTLRATDGAGNFTSCTQNIQVRDNTPPVAPVQNLTNFPTIPLTTCSNAPVSYTVPTPAMGLDNCLGAITPLATPAMPASFPVGTTTVTWTYWDTYGNNTTRTQLVTVTNSVTPSMTSTCPPSVTVNSSAGSDNVSGDCQAAVTWTPPVATDCDGDYNPGLGIGSIIGSHTPGAFFPVGPPTTVVYYATDAAGHIGICTFNVTVVDNEIPTITNPPALAGGFNEAIAAQAQGVCGRIVTWTTPTLPANSVISDNCSLASALVYRVEVRRSPFGVADIVNYQSGGLFAFGSYQLFYFVRDNSNNSLLLKQSATIVVSDGQFPSIVCPSNQQLNTEQGVCTADLQLPSTVVQMSDNCGAPTLTGPFTDAGLSVPATLVSGSKYRFSGMSTVYFKATDSNALTASCSFTVTVTDNQVPVLSAGCPPSATPVQLNAGASCTASYTLPVITATDNCTSPITPVIRVDNVVVAGPSVTLSEGSHTVSFTATDARPNSTACSYTVEVRNTVAPTFANCPGGIGATMNVNVSPTNTCVHTLTGSSFTGLTQLNLSGGGAGCDLGIMSFARLTSGGPVSLPLGTGLPLGMNVLRATVSDFSGNTASCQFSVMVQDLQAPVAKICPPANNQTIFTAANSCTATPQIAVPTIEDNCSLQSTTATVANSNVNSGNPLPFTLNTPLQKGTNIITYNGVDASGNVGGFCTFTVTVTDNVKPTFTAASCTPVTVNTNGPTCNPVATWNTPSATDNCSGVPAITQTLGAASGSTFALSGSPYTIRYQAQDASGNTETCQFLVTIVDNTGPAFTTCPTSPAPFNIVTGCVASYTWADPTGVTDCTTSPAQPSFTGPVLTPTASVTGNASARTASFFVGTTVVRYTATDALGNTSVCSFSVVVNNNSTPVFTNCPVSPLATVSVPAGANCSAVLTAALLNDPLYRPAATSECSDPVVTYTSSYTDSPNPSTPQALPYTQSVSTALAQQLRVTWTATKGNQTATCTKRIVIVDQTAPVLTCSPYTVVVDVPGNNFISSSSPNFNPRTTITVSDNCASLTASNVNATPTLLAQYPVGNSVINWVVSDGTNNSTCSQQITVQSTACTATTATMAGCTAAVATFQDAQGCPASISVTPAMVGLSATDNCGNAVTVIPTVSTLSATGTAQTVTFTATVGASVATCVKSIIVTPFAEICGNGIDDDCNPATSDVCPVNPAPTFVGCPLNSVLTVNAANCSATGTFTAPATVPAGLTVTTTGATSPYQNGAVITYTASNGNGTATCTRTITVNPAAAEVCGNGIDDDCDGLTDAADPDCGAIPGNCAVVRRLASDGLANDYFGSSVDIDGDIAVVGAHYDDNPGMNSGGVYVLARGVNNTWLQVAKISPTDGTSSAGDWFGRSVAIDGDYIVVGAPQEAGSGGIYVFRKGATAATWTQVARFVDATGVTGDQLGYAVDISENYIIAGAPNDEPVGALANSNNGSVSIYQRNIATSVWSLIGKRVASDGLAGDAYGSSVSIDGDFAAIGAPMDDYAGNRINAGSVYVNENLSNAWSEIAHLHASDYLRDDNYGTSVAISGANLFVGSPLNDVSAKQNAGSVYVHFQDEGGINAWGEVENLIADDFTAADQFGISVAADGDVVAIGAHFDDVHGFHSGSGYIFDGSGGWLQVAKLDDAFGELNDNFGYAIGLSGTTVIIGAWKDDNFDVLDQGSVSIFDDCSNLFQSQAENREEAVATPLPAKAGKVLCAPNPATDIINIDVTLPQEEAVRITVCDATGRLLETVFDGKSAAESRFQWDGGRYGRGVYFIRVQSASVSKVVSVTILR